MNNQNIKIIQCQSCFAPLSTSRILDSIVKCEFCGVRNVLPEEIRKVVAVDNHAFTMKLTNALSCGFDLKSLEVMVFDLSTKFPHRNDHLDWEDLSNNGKKAKCLDLVRWCQRRNYLQYLVDVALSHNSFLDI